MIARSRRCYIYVACTLLLTMGAYVLFHSGIINQVTTRALPLAELRGEEAINDLSGPDPEGPTDMDMADSTVETEAFDLEVVSKFQREQVDAYCRDRSDTGAWPLDSLMIWNKESKTVFCYVPKGGCISLLLMFMTKKGYMPMSVLEKKGYDWSAIAAAISRTSFKAKSQSLKKEVIDNYYKFIMYRNPLDRLVSAYKDKTFNNSYYSWIKDGILSLKKRKGGASSSTEVNFLGFVEYFLSRPDKLLSDIHFLPIQRLCHPCHVRYDYYGNFDSFERDAHILMDRFGASDEYLRPSYYSNASTTHYEDYYKLLSEDQRRSIFNYYKEELEFYYLLFPKERGIHKSILNISDDI